MSPLAVLSSLRSLVGIDNSIHILPVAVGTRLVDVAADGEQSVGVSGIGRANRGLAGVDQLLRALHPLAAIFRARNQHQQVAAFGQRNGGVANGGPLLVSSRTDVLRAALGDDGLDRVP